MTLVGRSSLFDQGYVGSSKCGASTVSLTATKVDDVQRLVLARHRMYILLAGSPKLSLLERAPGQFMVQARRLVG